MQLYKDPVSRFVYLRFVSPFDTPPYVHLLLGELRGWLVLVLGRFWIELQYLVSRLEA